MANQRHPPSANWVFIEADDLSGKAFGLLCTTLEVRHAARHFDPRPANRLSAFGTDQAGEFLRLLSKAPTDVCQGCGSRMGGQGRSRRERLRGAAQSPLDIRFVGNRDLCNYVIAVRRMDRVRMLGRAGLPADPELLYASNYRHGPPSP
jgi:hypothetical protein